MVVYAAHSSITPRRLMNVSPRCEHLQRLKHGAQHTPMTPYSDSEADFRLPLVLPRRDGIAAGLWTPMGLGMGADPHPEQHLLRRRPVRSGAESTSTRSSHSPTPSGHCSGRPGRSRVGHCDVLPAALLNLAGPPRLQAPVPLRPPPPGPASRGDPRARPGGDVEPAYRVLLITPIDLLRQLHGPSSALVP